MFEYWEVLHHRTGKVIAHCGCETDARNLCEMKPLERIYRKARFLQDQVINVTASVDPQLPGQIGLPPATIRVGGQVIAVQQSLPQGETEVFKPKQ